uniref:UDP-N-acetylglucosamine transferase subunit ALG13 n=1 Tax=Acrobeloides nanus TaxID=290746 RepID=A0A914DLE5_9BILA
MQYGSGQIDELENKETSNFIKDGINIEYFRYKPNIDEEMKNADLIIGHAGAGTCLESLKLGKPLIVVINEKLMNNHQFELAEKLAELGHVLYSTPSTLNQILQSDKMFHLKPFNNSERGDFAVFLDGKLGLNVA